MRHLDLADWTLDETKRDPRTRPSGGEDGLAAVIMEHVTTLQHDGGDGGERVGEADHAHVVTILSQTRLLVASLKTGQTLSLIRDASARMTAGIGLDTS